VPPTELQLESDPPATGRALRTLVFTDIVASTEHLGRLGDVAWRDLLDRHDRAVREQVRIHGGEVNNKLGDGFFLSFPTPGAAVQSARSAIAAVRPLGLELRAGVHTGECELHDETLVGMAVHVAHRVTSHAGGGEVLVSRTARDLLEDSDIRLADRGLYELKGIPGKWRLFGLRDPGSPPGAVARVGTPGARDGVRDLPVAPAAAVPRVARDALVGRGRELRELEQALAEASTGRGSFFLLAGEPGVGKTRLAEAISERARAEGGLVLSGHCWEGGGAPAFWPWVAVLRTYLREHGSDATLDRARADAYIRQLVPELQGSGLEAPHAPSIDSENARFALFDAVAGFLREAAREAPVVIVLEDLHAADEPSLLLLSFLARELRTTRVLVIGTYRPLEGMDTADLLGRLSTQGRMISLQGLGAGDVRKFVADRTGAAAAEGLTRELHALTEGNPFFMEEVLRLLLAEGLLDRPEALSGGRLPVPAGVREAIHKRLRPLSDEVMEVLRRGAVIGKEFTFRTLERICDTEPDRLLELIDEATSRGVVIEMMSELGRYRFAHALLREVLYEDLSRGERVRLHRLVGGGLESVYAQDLDPHLAELAHHFLQAAPGGDAGRAVLYATRAGHRSMTMLAFEEAARHYEHAHQAQQLSEPFDSSCRCELLLSLGAAQAAAGRRGRARETFMLAAGLAQRSGDHDRQAQAALGFAGRHWITGISEPAVVKILEDALAALPADGLPVLRAALLARLASELYYSPSAARAAALSDEAVVLARAVGDPSALAPVLEARLTTAWGPDNLDERLALTDEVIELADASGDAETGLRGRAFRVTCLLERGEVHRADRELARAVAMAEELRQPRFVWHTTALRAARALMSGLFAEAEELAERALAAGTRADEPNAPHYYGIQRVMLRYSQGRWDEIEAPIKAFVDRFPNLVPWRCTLALLYAELGREEDARREFERAAADDWSDMRRDSTWLFGVCRAAETCARLGYSERAPRLYELLEPHAGQIVVLGRVASLGIGSGSRYLGLLSATMSRTEEAAAHFERARRENTRIGAAPWLAHTCHDYAEALGSGPLANELDGEALALAERLGMPRLAQRIAAA